MRICSVNLFQKAVIHVYDSLSRALYGQVNEKILSRPTSIPAIHCYLGQKVPHEYVGKAEVRPLHKWLTRLVCMMQFNFRDILA